MLEIVFTCLKEIISKASQGQLDGWHATAPWAHKAHIRCSPWPKYLKAKHRAFLDKLLDSNNTVCQSLAIWLLLWREHHTIPKPSETIPDMKYHEETQTNWRWLICWRATLCNHRFHRCKIFSLWTSERPFFEQSQVSGSLHTQGSSTGPPRRNKSR